MRSSPSGQRINVSYDTEVQNLLVQRPHQFSIDSNTLNKPRRSVGKPAKKKNIDKWDVFALLVSFLCLALALSAVVSENLSWRLGVRNYQLIVLGFLLSIMNLCLAEVTPALLLLLEARFGPSTL